MRPLRWAGTGGGPRSSVKWRSELPVTGRTTTARERGVQAMSGQLRISSAHMATFGRKVGIESIEGVLDRAHRVL